MERVNSDLANDLGNLLNRTVAMVDKYFDGVVPAFSAGVTPFDATIEEAAKSVYEKVETAMENMEFSVALTAISQFVSRATNILMRPSHGRWPKTRANGMSWHRS